MMHSQQYSITVLICRRSKKNYPKIKGTTTLVTVQQMRWENFCKYPTQRLVVCLALKAKGGDAYSTLANAKWDNPLSSISDVEAVLGYFKRDCWFRRSIVFVY
ncbi:putative isoleucine--tRNA ligase [Trichinella spiralis]|uniref:Isoleucine--tRNA ligase n=1 Tax=Trichinella spiralis TaxID=6334 RepID=A0ABR3KYB1_TRISP